MMKRQTLTSDQAAAVERYARLFGAHWKASLRAAWETGRYSYVIGHDDRALLQQVRNVAGFTWLANAKVTL